MTQSSSIKSVLAFLIVTSFLLTPFSTVLSQSTPVGPNWWEDEGGDSDSEEESEEEKDKRLAEETQTEIQSAASDAGLSLGIGAVYGADPSGSSVTVDGVSMGKEQALAAIGAMETAKEVGALGVIDTDKTLAAYANGDVCAGCVVGLNTGVTGAATDVAHAEADFIIGQGVVVKVRDTKNLAPIPAKDLPDALDQIGNNSLQANVLGLPPGSANFDTFGNVVVKPNVYQEYKTTQQVTHAGKNRLTNTSFTYDSTTGNFIGGQNGAVVSPSSVPGSEKVISLAGEGPGKVVSIDYSSGKGTITSQDVFSGRVNTYDAPTGKAVNPNTIINESTGDLLFSPKPLVDSRTQDPWGMGVAANQLVNLSPMQKVALGERISSDDISELARTFADVAVGENSPLALKIGRGEPLTAAEMAEFHGYLGVMANRAAAEGKTILSYVTTANFSSWNNGNRERLRENERDHPNYDHQRVVQAYKDLLDGTTATRTFSKNTLSDITPAPFATHFYSGDRADISWSSYIIPGTEIRAGDHNFANLLLEDRSRQQYLIGAQGLPDNIKILNTTVNPIGEVGEIIDYESFYAGNIVKDKEMSQILGPALAYSNYFRPTESEGTILNVNTPIERDLPQTTAESSVVMKNQNAARFQNVTDELRGQLDYAAAKVGVEVVVFSGGQYSVAEARAMGAVKDSEGYWKVPKETTLPDGTKVPAGTAVRYGNTSNHDDSKAADVWLVYKGTDQILYEYNPQDQERMKEFLAQAVAAGANGIGGGAGYMGAHKMHIGGKDSPITWGGPDARGVDTVSWVAEANKKGIELRSTFDSSEAATLIGYVAEPGKGLLDNLVDIGKGAVEEVGKLIPKEETETVKKGVEAEPGKGLLDNLIDIGKGAVEEVGKLIPKEVTETVEKGVEAVFVGVDELNKIAGNPMAMWWLKMVGRGGTGGAPPESLVEDNGGGSEPDFVCPPRSQLTPAYLDSITNQSLLQKLLKCPLAPQTNLIDGSTQSATAFTSLFSGADNLINRFLRIFRPNSQPVTAEETAADVSRPSVILPVTITIDASSQSVILSRDDIHEKLEADIDRYSKETDELAEIVRIMEETPLLFDDQGNIINSNGLYSPAMVNGEKIPTDIDYSYLYMVKYLDENGNETELDPNTDSLPENNLTRFFSQVFSDTSTFSIDAVRNVSRQLIDPDKKIRGDEYYKYSINLNNGTKRSVTVPQYTSVRFMEERFGSVGYEGNALSLVGISREVASDAPSSLFTQLSTMIKDAAGKFMNIFNDPNDKDPDQAKLLPQFGDKIPTASDIHSVFIYPSANVPCSSDLPDFSRGFMYTAVINDPEDANNYYAVTDGRCGHGSPEELVIETARHLSERYSIEDVTANNINAKTAFRIDSVLFTPSITKVPKTSINTTPVVPTEPEEPTPTEPNLPTDETPTQVPNITNEVVFEVKAVGSDGRILADWVETEKITISQGVQVYFRWDGSQYQQCLPFLNDNGNYSLTRKNRAMTTGNTEEEQYNVTERSAIYRVECGGQKNSEFGVDAREIEVMMQ